MTTKLEGSLKREIAIGGEAYTVTIDPHGLKLVPKGRRKGFELEWQSLVSGEAALATALNASIAAAPEPRAARTSEKKAALAPLETPKKAPARKKKRAKP